MHSILFGVKRTFHKSTWFGRAILEPYELTPSRFDVLFILQKSPFKHVWQSSIRKILGVRAPTTSIMVRALARLGLVRRRQSEDDKRQVEVSLTKRGRSLIRRAAGALRTKQIIDYLVRRLVSPIWWDEGKWLCDLETLDNQLKYTRSILKDRACLSYPWHPED